MSGGLREEALFVLDLLYKAGAWPALVKAD